jgi:hypothetical protein
MRRNWQELLPFLVSAPAALAVGSAARLWFYFLNDSFWRDESMLLLNVAQKSFTQLLGPLEFAQEAPVPLLWFYRLLYLTGLGGEMPMRALSLVTSILALFLFYRLAQRVLEERRAVLFSTWLLALAPGAILFAAQTKPYSLDLLVAAGLLYLAAPWFLSPKGARQIWYLAGAAALAPWFSLPAVFVAGGIGAGLLLRARQGGIRPALVFLAVVSGSFALEFFLVLNRCLLLEEYIRQWFLHFSSSGLKWALCQIFYAYLGPQGHASSLPLWGVVALALGGIWEAGRKFSWVWVAVLILPLVLALGASTAKLYPIFGRLFLFATPGIFLLVGHGVALMFRTIPWPRLGAVLLLVLIFPCLQASQNVYGRPVGGVREGLQFVAARRQPQDLVLGDSFALPTIAYYRLLKRPDALTLNAPLKVEEWSWGKVDPWILKFEVLLPLISEETRVWLVAETLDYARAGVTEVLPHWQSLTEHLSAERKLLASYITERVQVRGFSPSRR